MIDIPDGAHCIHCGARFLDGKFVDKHMDWCPYLDDVELKMYQENDGSMVAGTSVRNTNDKKGLFLDGWEQVNKIIKLPDPVEEYKFHPDRKWQFDWSWPDYKLAVEVDGRAKWVKGGGSHAQDTDREKHNAAAEAGWTTLRFSTDMLKLDATGCAAQAARILIKRVIT